MAKGLASQNQSIKHFREISRLLTIVENELEGSDEILKGLRINNVPVIGITGPPGAGKSTLVSKLAEELIREGCHLAVLAVDPTSPFTSGSLLGDRIRMQRLSPRSDVYMRSVATRGALGGLSGKIIEMTDVLKSFDFNYILIETVGVGQSEIEIAELADLTLVVLVPESGDEIQSIKAGIMEIADAFVVNKADREGADHFANNLRSATQLSKSPVFKTIATSGDGVADLVSFIRTHQTTKENKVNLLAKKAWNLIMQKRMADIDIHQLKEELAKEASTLNLYQFTESKVRNS